MLPVLGQGYATQLISHTTVDMTTGDLDADGDIDIISGGIRNLVWNENQGDGTFVSRTISLDAQEVQTVLMRDLDQDGHQDLVVADMAVSRILYYHNNGDNTFDRFFLHVNNGGTSGIAIADLDGDGDLDLACTAFTQNKVYWLRNNGGFAFTAIDVATGLTGVSHVVAHDYDGDGDVDLAVTVQTAGAARLLRNNGAATFTNELLATMTTPRMIGNDDVDQDGDMDILYSGGGGTGWFENTGAAFTQRSVFTYNGARGVGAGDLNGDGYKDLVVCDYEEDDLIWRGYSATGQFTSPGAILDSDFDYISMAFAVDLDNDGDLDIAAGSSFDLRVYINNGTATFTKRLLNRYLGDGRGIDHGDFDGDGDIDLMAVGGLHMTWHENDGTGHLTARIVREGPARIQVNSGVALRTADLDGDGDDDAILCERSGNKVSWIENLGGGNFAKRLLTNLTNAYSCDPLDFDGDGDMDVIATSLNGGDVYWYENDGNQAFTQHAINTSYPTPYEARGHDFDNDGDMDVIVACYSNLDVMGKVVLNVNQGDGTFDDYEIDETAPNVTSVFWVDLDGDGDEDILSATADNDCLNWYEYDGSWFTEHILAYGVDFATYVVAADLDGDGDVDMAATALSDRTTDWYENDGNEVFTRHELARNVVNPQFIGIGDIDADGTPEIYATCVETDAVHLYRRTGLTSEEVVGPVPTACHDLFISEMLHQPGDVARGLEIYNPRSVDVDLTGYAIRFYANGDGTQYSTAMLAGIIPAHGTHVLSDLNAPSPLAAMADQLTYLWFDGADGIALVHDGVPIDIIGKVGEVFEDGDYWFSNGIGTFNTVLVRKPTIDKGDADGSDEYLPDVEWIEYPANDMSHMGSHDAPCGAVCTPSLIISADQTEICAGNEVVVTATPTSGGTAPVYAWTLNGAAVGTNSATYTTPILTTDAVVRCTIVSNAACSAGADAESNAVAITVVPALTPVASVTGTLLTASPVPNATYQWYEGGDPIAGATGQSYTAPVSGFYTVAATVDGCTSEHSNSVQVLITGMNGSTALENIAVFPNPTEGLLFIRSADAVEYVIVFDAVGAKVAEARTTSIDLHDLAPGMYTVLVRTTSGQAIERIMVR